MMNQDVNRLTEFVDENKHLFAGKYITIDGADGCGKTHQIELLRRFLDKEQFSVSTVREPNEPYRSILIKGEAKSTHTELLVSLANFIDSNAYIEQRFAIDSESVVISDRGELSMVMYQGFLMDETIVDYPIHWFPTIGMVLPDVRIILCTPESIRKERLIKRGLPLDRYDEASGKLDKYFADFQVGMLTRKQYGLPPIFGLLDYEKWGHYLSANKDSLLGWRSFWYLRDRGYSFVCVADTGESPEEIQLRIQAAALLYLKAPNEYHQSIRLC